MIKLLDYEPRVLFPLALKRNLITKLEHDFVLTLSPWYSFIDRTYNTNIGPNTKVITPIPTGAETRSLSDLMDEESIKLITEGKPMALYWSGGIDSTMILAGLLKNGVKKDQLTVVLTPYSILEYPNFYKDIVSKCNIRKVGAAVYPYVRTDELIVNGNHGDPVFGSGAIYTYYIEKNNFSGLFTDSWEDCAIARAGGIKEAPELISPIIEAAPFPIVTAFDLCWWLGAATKWQYLYFGFCSHIDDTQSFLKSVRNFFAADTFQLWARDYNNHRYNKIGDTIESFKFVGKEYINDFYSDADYLKYKRKDFSLPTYIVRPFLGLLEDGTRIAAPKGMDTKDAVIYFDKMIDTGKFEETYGFKFEELFYK